ncbi:hypothetical protein J1614_001513 [Plenodomus biglobosus]|nr:hypothetical protein J1614_001513 [Plenodomus biglobosus]
MQDQVPCESDLRKCFGIRVTYCLTTGDMVHNHSLAAVVYSLGNNNAGMGIVKTCRWTLGAEVKREIVGQDCAGLGYNHASDDVALTHSTSSHELPKRIGSGDSLRVGSYSGIMHHVTGSHALAWTYRISMNPAQSRRSY